MTTLSRAPRSARFEARRFPARRRSMLASTALGAALLLWQNPVHAGPDGERVVAGQQTEATANITAKEIVVSGITASNKTYDGTTGATLVVNAANFDGKLAADTLTLSGSGAFDNKNVGSNKKVTISNLVLGGTDARNYVLKASGQQTETSANITAKEIVVSGITASNKTYDGGTVATLVVNAANFDGKLADDTLTVSGTGAFADKDVSANKKVTISDLVLSGVDANNYVLKGSGQQTETTASITAKEIVISGVSASNKTYDGDTAATLVLTSVTFGGKLGTDALTLTATGAFDNKNAGSNKKVTISSLTLGGTDAKNYVLKASGQQSETSATILRKEVTVSGITAGDKIYDGNQTGTVVVSSANFTGKLAGDKLGITATGTFADKDVGANKKVVLTNLTLAGDDANNYILQETGQQIETTASITAREITISGITASNKIYDGGTTATLTYSGVQFGGKLGADVLTITATGEFADKDVGTNKKVSLTALTLGGTDAKNYVLKGSGQQSETSASITAREIIVSGITANNKTYDGTTNVTLVVSSASFGGKLANETLSVSATGAFDSKDAGSDKRVMIGGLTLGGTDARNYVLKSSGQQTETRATIDQKEITVAGLKAQDKTYDGKVSASFDSSRATYSFKVASDDLGVAATGAFDDAGVGANKNASITSITLTGRDAGNYRLATSGQQVASTASIHAASLLVRVNDVDRDGDGRPFVGPYEVSYSGFVNGEGPSVLRGQLTFSGTGVTAAADGVYEVSASGLRSDNYVITYVAGTLTIGRTPVVESVQVARLPIIPVRSFVEKVPIIPVCQPMLFVSATTLPDDQQRLFAATSTVCQ